MTRTHSALAAGLTLLLAAGCTIGVAMPASATTPSGQSQTQTTTGQTVAPGGSIVINHGSFTADSPVEIWWIDGDASTLLDTLSADMWGDISAEIPLPAGTLLGEYVMELRDTASGTVTTETVTVAGPVPVPPKPSLSISENRAPGGTTNVIFPKTYFGANEVVDVELTGCTLTAATGDPNKASLPADAAGALTVGMRLSEEICQGAFLSWADGPTFTVVTIEPEIPEEVAPTPEAEPVPEVGPEPAPVTPLPEVEPDTGEPAAMPEVTPEETPAAIPLVVAPEPEPTPSAMAAPLPQHISTTRPTVKPFEASTGVEPAAFPTLSTAGLLGGLLLLAAAAIRPRREAAE